VGLLRKNWYAAFPADAEHPDKQDVVGYVYAPLLKDSAPAE
jgi:hypothetical protein